MDTNIPLKEILSVHNTKDDSHLSLSSKEWSLLTHIVRTYDVDTALKICQNLRSQKRKRNLLALEFFQENTKHSKISSNTVHANQSLLSSNQWTLLSNVIQTYNTHSAIPVVQNILAKQSSYQPKFRFKLDHTLKLIKKIFLSTNLCMSNIFSHTLIDQYSQEQIMKHNSHTLDCLNGLFTGRETYLLHNRAQAFNFKFLYTEDLMLITNRLIYQLELNDVLLKLFIIVLAFSTRLSVVSYSEDCSNENSYHQLNQYENIFIDLLWKYMLYKYDFQECIYRFCMMIKIVLDLLNLLHQTEIITD